MNQLINNRDLDFQLYELLDLDRLFTREKFQDHNKETFAAALDTAEKIATKFFLPHNHLADQNEPLFVDGEIKMIPQVKIAFDAYAEAGFIAAGMDYEVGGMQLPYIITLAASAYFTSANPATTGYGFLTTGAANLINTFASSEQKDQFLPAMLTGKFSGTMALTEPGAGSSLADITTQALEQSDGTYKIKGQKIFISGGDHQLTSNIIHLVLAKIKGSPEGVKGISLFIVPKYRLKNNNQPAEPNDVNLAGLFHKMGYRGTTSTSLSFGEKDDCTGYLIGEQHQGLKYMFHMMNEARLAVGFGATIIGYRGYLASLAYAKERPQGRQPSEKDPLSPQINIIKHADVKRMLLAQKAFTEGGLSLCFYCACLVDDVASGNEKQQTQAQQLLDLLMPVVKACNSEYGLKANDLAIQVLGGAGYTHEYPVEQCYRDNRLNPIHEGTNGIQALDLLGRKIWQHNSAGLQLLFGQILEDLERAKSMPETLPKSLEFSQLIKKALNCCHEITALLAASMQKNGPEKTLANASCYLAMMGKLIYSWMWLRQAIVSEEILKNNQMDEKTNQTEFNFYQGKLKAAQYFIQWELPKLYQDASLLKNFDDTCLSMQEDWF